MTKLETSIINTLAYSDIFNFPLKEDEIHLRLIGEKSTPTKTASTIARLIKSGSISHFNGFYFLPGRKDTVALRNARTKISQEKLIRAKRLSSLLALTPTITGIFATGTLAVNNAKQDDDIDLMLITRPRTLWTTRMLITPLLDLFSLRRKPHNTTASDLLCLNIYMSEDSLTIPEKERSLYTAYELIQTIPLVDKADTHNNLLASNSWINDYLPNYPLPALSKVRKPGINPLEKPAFHLQLNYMKDKITNERISLSRAFFHPRDLSPDIMAKFKKRKNK